MPTLLKKSDWDETRCQTGWNAVLPLKTKWKIRYHVERSRCAAEEDGRSCAAVTSDLIGRSHLAAGPVGAMLLAPGRPKANRAPVANPKLSPYA